MARKILYISYDGMTDPLGQSQVLPYLVALSAKGYEFTLLSFEKKQRYEKEGALVQDIAQKAGIKWVPLMYTKSPPVLAKIYDRWQMRKEVINLYKREHFDMIHCRSYVSSEMGLWLKKKYRTKFLFDMRGFWADEKVDNGQWNMKKPFFRYVYNHYKGKEREFLLEADGIISLTHAAKKEIIRKQEYSHLQIDVVPCCADLRHFDYNNVSQSLINELKQKTGVPPGAKVITYLGSVGGWYMTKEMFAFFRRLLMKRRDFIMLILTKDDPAHVRMQAVEMGIAEDKLIVLYAGRNELPGYISLSDCSIFFIRPTYSKMASSPTKHAELMGMGVPVICNNIGDTGHIIEKTMTGVVIKEFTDAGYDQAINKLDEVLNISKKNIRQAAFEYFDLEKGVNDYLQVYKRILKD